MKVDRNRFLEEGYVVLRNVIPAGELDALRASYEILVERQKVIWAQERKPGDPPGGRVGDLRSTTIAPAPKPTYRSDRQGYRQRGRDLASRKYTGC